MRPGDAHFPRSQLPSCESAELGLHARELPRLERPGGISVGASGDKKPLTTLVINAQYDAQTAASFGAYVAKTLPNSTVVTIPNVAHVAFGSPSAAANACAYAIARSFFDAPNKADTSCVRNVPPTKFEL